MAKKKKSIPENNVISAEEAGREFGITLKQLETLMQTRGHDGVAELNEIFGGLSGLGQKLKTNLVTGKISKTKKNYFLKISLQVYPEKKQIYPYV
jgi:hypothetical protein